MNRRQFTALSSATLLPPLAAAYEPASVVDAMPGTLPVLFTVPHDGAEFLGLFPHRTQGTTVRDLGTRALAERVAALLHQQLGHRPYLVVAKFSRKHLDANRSEADAMESPAMLPAYRAYHDHVAAYVAQIRKAFPSGALLIDVHGQSQEPGTTFRGTRAGLTVKRLLGRFGPAALQGPDSIFGQLAAKGYAVNPAADAASMREDPRFAGGYTVFTYGSHRPDGIDAIQFEFGGQHRSNPRLPEDFAAALVGFMKAFDLLPK
ncbi:N-formylglutamate amidohydrolase [Hydrogenophaga sp.]